MMESSSKSKRRGSQDMISNLPDSIITHILYFLSTKQAVLTSALSQRWIYMWTFVNKLSFNDRDNNSSNMSVSFTKFVNRVLFHLNTAIIQEFHLSTSKKHDPYYINQWISCILNRGVKKINVCISGGCDTLCFPLFKCQSLEELVFETRNVFCDTMKLPSFVCLSSLTILKLFGIKFTCYSSNEFKDLTLNFPLLREYETRYCSWSDLKSITIQAPLLESVDINSSDKPNESQIIKFYATHITKFSYTCPISLQTILLDHQYIPSARLHIFDFNECSAEESWIFIRRLLCLFIYAEYLDLCFDSVHEGLALDGIPTFQMLVHLQLNFTSDVLLGILFKSPCLKTLVFEMTDRNEEPRNFAIVPYCFISSLKVVKFDNYFGGDRELCFAKFVMENAKVLESISFSFTKWKSFSEKMESAREK